MSNFDSGAKKRMIDNQVFHIRIGATTEKLDIKDPAFLKLLKQ